MACMETVELRVSKTVLAYDGRVGEGLMQLCLTVYQQE